jgi:hypothetical protein
MASSQTQLIFSPPWHFSNRKVQRGTIIQFAGDPIIPGMTAGIPGAVIPAIPIGPRSIIIPVIGHSFPCRSAGDEQCRFLGRATQECTGPTLESNRERTSSSEIVTSSSPDRESSDGRGGLPSNHRC